MPKRIVHNTTNVDSYNWNSHDPFDRIPSNGKEGTNTIKVPMLNSLTGYNKVDTGAHIQQRSNKEDFYNYPLFANRIPTPSYEGILENQFKSASAGNMVTLNGKEIRIAMLTDPYNAYVKAQIEDSYRKNHVIQHGIHLYTALLLGKRTKTIVDVNREFMNLDVQKQTLANTFNDAEIDKTRTWCDRINRQVKFHQNLYSLALQSRLGGRAAMGVETGTIGEFKKVPIALKLLNWRKLGQVYADINTWEFLGVEYADKKTEAEARAAATTTRRPTSITVKNNPNNNKPTVREDSIYQAADLVYLPHADHHVTANSLYYGTSVIEPLLDISHANRIINEEDLKEAPRIAWTSNGRVIFPPNTPRPKIVKFMQEFRPGWNGTTLDVDVKTDGLEVNIDGITNLRTLNNGELQQGLRLPSFVMGRDKDVPNRSVAEISMHVWRESELNYSRTWLQDYLETQWFDSLIQIRYPQLDINDMWIKAKLEFQDITFESLKDRVDALVPLVQNKWIPIEKALDIWDMSDVKDQVLAMQAQVEAEKQKEMQLRMEELRRNNDIAADQAKGGGGQFGGNSNNNNNNNNNTDTKDGLAAMQRSLKKAGIKSAKLVLPNIDEGSPLIINDDVGVQIKPIIESQTVDMEKLMNDMKQTLLSEIKQASAAAATTTTIQQEQPVKTQPEMPDITPVINNLANEELKNLQIKELKTNMTLRQEEHDRKMEALLAFQKKIDQIKLD